MSEHKKLTTLRDIELYHKINTDARDDYDVLYQELKDAAREWIHHIQDREDKTLPFICDKDTKLPVDGDTAVIVFLKMFFNLEEP